MGHKWIDPTKLQGFVCGVISWSCFIFGRQGIKQTLPISMNFIHPTIIDHFIISINIIVLCIISFINPFYEYGFISKRVAKHRFTVLDCHGIAMGWTIPTPRGHMGMGLSVDFSGIFHEINFQKQPLGHPRNLDFFWTPDGWNPWNPLESKRPSPCRRRVRRSANACCAWKPSWGLRRNCVASCIKKQPLVWCYGAKKSGP